MSFQILLAQNRRSLQPAIQIDRKIICLCGSTKFKQQYDEINAGLTLQGNIVLSCGFFSHFNPGKFSEEDKRKADLLHKDKILMSDEIFVIDVDQYIGDSTRSEIEFAKEHGKKISYYSIEIQMMGMGSKKYSNE